MIKRTSLACAMLLQAISIQSGAEVFSAAGLANPIANNGASARALAMGSAYVAVPGDSSALFWNPSGLSKLDGAEITLHHNSWLAGIIQETVVLGLPLAALGGIALEVDYINYGTLNSYDSSGTAAGTYSPGRYGLGVGWGIELLEGFSAGAGLKGMYQSIGDNGYSAISLDLGALWNPIHDLNLGIDVSGLGTNVAGYAQSAVIRFGAALKMRPMADNQLLVAVGATVEPNGVHRLQVGAEDLIHQFLALRLGYQFPLSETQIGG